MVPALLRTAMVDRKEGKGKVVETRVSRCIVNLEAHHGGRTGVSAVAVTTSAPFRRAEGIRYGQLLYARLVRFRVVVSEDAMMMQFAEELDAQQAKEGHEEEEEKGDVVYLLTRSEEDLRYSGTRH